MDRFQGAPKEADGVSQLPDSLQVAVGTAVVLSWTMSNAPDGVELSGPDGTQQFESGSTSTEVTPLGEQQDYTLVAIAGDARSEAKTVHVSTNPQGQVFSPHSNLLPPEGETTDAGPGQELLSPRFQGDAELKACCDRKHRMMAPEHSPAVGKVQLALIDLGFDLSRFGPDQEFGDETGNAVVQFKTTRGIHPTDPVVGPLTMAQLDREIVDFDAGRGHQVIPSREFALSVATISWIEGTPSPIDAMGLEAAVFVPAWIPATYVGLGATRNPPPPVKLDRPTRFRAVEQFRAMTFCSFIVDADPETDQVLNVRVQDAFQDPGFTPPFDTHRFPPAIFHKFDLLTDLTFAPGEASVISQVAIQARHPNTTIEGVPDEEVVLVNSLIKFRAGKRTDDIGVGEVKSDFHVPWVWCEVLLTYAGQGRFKLYGRGSVFPSHAFYFGSGQVGLVPEVGDSEFPIVPDTGLLIASEKLKLFPVLSKGAPASGPQSANAPSDGPVHFHPNTADELGRLVTVTKSL